MGTPHAAEVTRRRLLVDMHVPDYDPGFLREVDAEALAADSARAGFARVLLDANSHTGLNHWPSSVGKDHAVVSDRDLFGDLVTAVRAQGLQVHAYYCSLFVDWYWDEHPEARSVDSEGRAERGAIAAYPRWAVLCPNNAAYREFVLTQLRELVTGYDLDGFWLDMISWSTVCYCVSCQERWAQEMGGELPREIDWHDPRWLTFQATRRSWLAEYAALLESTIHGLDPNCTVIHQSGPYCEDWLQGASTDMSRSTAALSADQYRDPDTMRMTYRIWSALGRPDPFEALSSWTAPDIREHVVPRTAHELEITAMFPIANGGAAGFVEAVDPSGRHAVDRFEAAAPLLRTVAALEPQLSGRLVQDVGIYVSYESSFDLATSGISPAEYAVRTGAGLEVSAPSAHRPAAITAGASLSRANIAWGVVTRLDLEHLGPWKVLVLPQVALLDDTELATLRRYVHDGGTLYASGATSLLGPDGPRQDFGLADLFGAHWDGETETSVSYLSPTPAGKSTFAAFTPARPFTLHARQLVVTPAGEAEQLAFGAPALTDPRDQRYASLLTDPPGPALSSPALLRRQVGAGTVVYAAGAIEAETQTAQREVFTRLVAEALSDRRSWLSDAPGAVDITVLDADDSRIVHALNLSTPAPPVPAHGIEVSFPGVRRDPRAVRSLRDGREAAWRRQNDVLTIALPVITTWNAVRIDGITTHPGPSTMKDAR